jgi:hypothetical protein
MIMFPLSSNFWFFFFFFFFFLIYIYIKSKTYFVLLTHQALPKGQKLKGKWLQVERIFLRALSRPFFFFTGGYLTSCNTSMIS